MRILEWIAKDRFVPDFTEFTAVVVQRKAPKRVHFAELLVDPEIVQEVTERFFGEAFVPPTQETMSLFLHQYVRFFKRLGYDYCIFVDVPGMGLRFPGKVRRGADTACLSRGVREWVEESSGVIASFADFESYPWPKVEDFDFSPYEELSRILPEGMKLLLNACGGIFEVVSETLLGFEGLSLLLYENRPLVQAVFERAGEIILSFYRELIDLDIVGGIFQGDDWGYRSATFLSPRDLEEFVFPWHRKLCDLAHEKGKYYFLHSCGNIYQVFDAFLDEVPIDAFHSFQDAILPVTEFGKRYGNRVGILGGVDLDKLIRLPEEDLRHYVRSILEELAPRGGFALGSGNSIANYVPLRQYLVMLDEGLRFSG